MHIRMSGCIVSGLESVPRSYDRKSGEPEDQSPRPGRGVLRRLDAAAVEAQIGQNPDSRSGGLRWPSAWVISRRSKSLVGNEG